MEKEINPSELTLWRVINKTPCNVELVSEYTSSTKVRFNGVIGYSNIVGALNEIARQYENKYVSSARMMGYDGSYFNFYGRYIASGLLNKFCFRRFNYNWTDIIDTSALRPIITLKSGVTTNGGSGTKVNPYTLS